MFEVKNCRKSAGVCGWSLQPLEANEGSGAELSGAAAILQPFF